MERVILRNAIKCNLCNDLIESIHRHDFKWCSCNTCAVDGGTDYLRRVGSNYIDTSIFYENQPFEVLRQYIGRTGYGKPGAKDYGIFRKTTLNNMTDEHLEASLEYLSIDKGGLRWQHLLEEKLYRVEHEIWKEEK